MQIEFIINLLLHIQDVTWIKQLQQKKEDLSLDYILATTTTDFTQSAINKARKHGVIIERAETFNINSVKEVTFEVGEKKNKKYCAIFGNENDYVEVGYIEDENYNNIKFTKRKYLRYFLI